MPLVNAKTPAVTRGSDIPQELWELVIDALAPSSPTALHALSLTRRSFQRRAQRNLLHAISLQPVLYPGFEHRTTTPAKFLSVLSNADDQKANCVRHLVLGGDFLDDPSVPGILEHLGQLESFELTEGIKRDAYNQLFFNLLPDTLQSAFVRTLSLPSLHRIRLENIHALPPDLFHFHESALELKELELTGTTFAKDVPVKRLPPNKQCALDTLTLSCAWTSQFIDAVQVLEAAGLDLRQVKEAKVRIENRDAVLGAALGRMLKHGTLERLWYMPTREDYRVDLPISPLPPIQANSHSPTLHEVSFRLFVGSANSSMPHTPLRKYNPLPWLLESLPHLPESVQVVRLSLHVSSSATGCAADELERLGQLEWLRVSALLLRRLPKVRSVEVDVALARSDEDGGEEEDEGDEGEEVERCIEIIEEGLHALKERGILSVSENCYGLPFHELPTNRFM